MPPKFFEGLSNEDMHNIKKIAQRYLALLDSAGVIYIPALIVVVNDITLYHQNYVPLALADLAIRPDITIKVVVGGLRQHIRNNPLKG